MHLRTCSALSRQLAALLLSSLLASAWMAPAYADDVAQTTQDATLQPLTQVEGISEYRLDNGLRIVLAPDASKPNTTVNMTYLVGSRHENYGQTGMAHLLEHMLFRGTPALPNALAEFSRRGLQANGSTSADRTNYYASFSADPDTLEWYIRWQADAMVNATISQKDLDSEMTVVRNEMERGENSPFQILMQKMQSAAFQWHNYGLSTIGARSDVENVDVEQLRAFYKQYYQPDNAVLIVSGRFDVDNTLDVIEHAFSSLKQPERRLPPEYTIEPVQDGERAVTLRRQGGSPLIAALYHIPAADDPSFIPLDLAVSILGDTPSGRLYKKLVQTELSTDVFGFAAGMRQPGYALFGAQLEPGMDQDKALSTLTDTLDAVAAEPFNERDLERIRNQWLTGWSRTFADPIHLANALSEAIADGDWRLFFLHRDQVKNATLTDVQDAVAAYLVPDNRTIGRYIPTDKPVRAPAYKPVDLDKILADYKGEDAGAATESFDPSPEHIDARTERSALELDNGTLELALLPKSTRGDRVEARLLLQFGDVNQLEGLRTAASATAALLDRGTADMSRQDISDRLDELRASVSFEGGAGSVSVSLSTTQEYLPDLIQLVTHILRDASFPESELAEFKRRNSTAISDAKADPQALASRALARHDNPWPANDIRYVPTFDETRDNVMALSRDDLIAFHKQFYGVGTLSFSAVGAFDTTDVKQALADGLNQWRKAPAYTRAPNPYHDVAPETFHIPTPGKANAFYLSVLPLELQDTDPEFAALYLANYLLGSSETSRLWNRIRTQDGLSYNVRSSLDLSSYEPSGSWSLYAIFAPENTDKLQNAVDDVLDDVLTNGFTDDEVKEGVSALLNYRKLARTRDGVLASTWLHYINTDRSFAWSQQIDDQLKGLTAKDVNAAIRAALDPDKLSTAIAADTEQP